MLPVMAAAPAGWYDDPDAPGMVRWWDGQAWAGMVMPASMAPAPPSTTDKVVAVAGFAAKAWFLLLLLAVCVILVWIAF